MKKNIAWALAAGAVLLGACQSNTKTTITGTLTGVESDTLRAICEPLFSDSKSVEVPLVLQQGSFKLQLEPDTVPISVTIIPTPEPGKPFDMTKRIDLLAFSGDQLTVKGDLKEYQVTGSDFYTAYNKLDEEMKPLNDSIKSIINRAMQMQQEGGAQDSIMKVVAPLEDLEKRAASRCLEYIRQHPDEDLSVFLAWRTGEKQEEALELLGDKAKNGKLAAMYQFLDKIIKEEQEKAKAKENVSEGKPAPDFTLKDLQGKDLTLSSLRGKYVVLDFWGSWCGWCIKGIPEMKKYYEKYKGKMEILGIDCRDTEEKWKEAVEKHELPWLHVRNEGNPDVSTLYAIEGYPTKIVIDPEGNIAKIVVGEDPAFYEYLDELFK